MASIWTHLADYLTARGVAHAVPANAVFEPDRKDANQLRWYFRQGPKPEGLTEGQSKRWRRNHRRLEGRGRRLCLYYTNPTGFHDPRLAALRDDEDFADALFPRTERHGQRGNQFWRVLRQISPLEWLQTADRAAKNGADSREERIILPHLRRYATEMLRLEYMCFVGRGEWHYADSRFEEWGELSRAAVLRLLGDRSWVWSEGGSPANLFPDFRDRAEYEYTREHLPRRAIVDVLLSALIRQRVLDVSTWGQLRVGDEAARFLALKLRVLQPRQTRDLPLAQVLAALRRRASELRRAQATIASAEDDQFDDAENETPEPTADERDSSLLISQIKHDLRVQEERERGNLTFEVVGDEDPTSGEDEDIMASDLGDFYYPSPERRLFIRSWGIDETQALPPGEWDRRSIETNVGKAYTTVTELAATYKPLPSTVVRRLLVEFGCPGADRRRARLPRAWLSSPEGGRFRAAALDLAAKEARLDASKQRRKTHKGR